MTVVRGRPRRAAAGAVREQLQAEAGRQLVQQGCSGTSLRSVARAVGVDPALVAHYFGCRAGLLRAAIGPAEALEDDLAPLLTALSRGDVDGLIEASIELLRTEAGSRRLVCLSRAALGEVGECELLLALLPSGSFDPGGGLLSRQASLALVRLAAFVLMRHVVNVPALVAMPPEELREVLRPLSPGGG